MIHIELVNDLSGNDSEGNYRYLVYLNERVLFKGKIKGHSRGSGYRNLLSMLGEEFINEYSTSTTSL